VFQKSKLTIRFATQTGISLILVYYGPEDDLRGRSVDLSVLRYESDRDGSLEPYYSQEKFSLEDCYFVQLKRRYFRAKKLAGQ